MNGRLAQRWVGWALAWAMVLGLWLAAPGGDAFTLPSPGGRGDTMEEIKTWPAGDATGGSRSATEAPIVPDEVVLWNQPLHAYDWSMVLSQEYPEYPTYSAYLADDFVNGEPWSIHTIFVPGDGWNGFYTLFGASTLHWMVYADCGGVPCGDPSGGGSSPVWSLTLAPNDPQVTITNGTSGYPSNTLLTLSTPFGLPPGTWWLIFYPTMYFDPYGQYGRQPASTANGFIGEWINPGGGYGHGTAWFTWDTLWPEPPLPWDVAFRLEGLAGLRVNSTGDEVDANLSDGVCGTAAVVCTLRAAIEQANYNGGGTITFAGMAGIPTIQPASALPALSAPITIDGTTAGGKLVELDGSLVTSGSGLELMGGGGAIKGLAINRFGDYGIVVESGNNLIEGNRIGTNAAGTADAGNGYGVRINGEAVAAATNTIRRNLISGNGNYGVYIDGALTSNNVVEGNYVGTDVTGNNPLPNSGPGVQIYNSASNRIGGAAAVQRNVISGNADEGVYISGGTGNVVQGNYVGTNAAGTAALPNAMTGIYVAGPGNTIGGPAAKAGGGCAPPCNLVSGNYTGIVVSAGSNVVQGNYVGTDVTGRADLGNSTGGVIINAGDDTVVGGLSAAEGNVIAFNDTGVSVEVSGGTGNAILGNAIWNNDQLGIDLLPAGVTPNDPGDGDTGPNQYQNYPELDWVATGPPSASTVISGTLDSMASTSFGIEFFYSDAADPSGNGEGQYYFGSAEVNTDGSGLVTFFISVPGTIPAASYVSATATDPGGNTSEFSAARVAIPETMIVVGPGVGGELIYTDTSVLSTTVEVPAGAFSETIVLAVQPMEAPSHLPLPSLRSGEETFDLSAYLGNDVLEGYDFLKPLTVTLRYTDTDVIGILESGLRLYYWDGSTWQDAADTCSPPSVYFLDTEENVMQVAICHLTEWNIQGPDLFPWKVHLPLALKGF